MSTIQEDAKPFHGPQLAGTLMTPEEFDAADNWDEDYDYELIRGILVVTPPVDAGERGSNEKLGHLLLSYQETHPQGSSLDLTLPENYIRTADSRCRADRVIWAGLGRMPNVRKDPPNIAVEFVSDGKRNRQRDYVDKRNEYMTAGLDEYWIIDRFRRMMTAIRNGQPDLVIGETEIYRTSLLPGFELPLAQLLAVAGVVVDDYANG